MSEVYNFRVGDLLYKKSDDGRSIMGLIYKMTPKYIYYAVCAGYEKDEDLNPFVSKGHKTKKEKIYTAVHQGDLSVSYANGLSRRRKIEGLCFAAD